MPAARIQADANSAGEYQTPPNTKADAAAAKTAARLIPFICESLPLSFQWWIFSC